jgi:hypothetical protein
MEPGAVKMSVIDRLQPVATGWFRPIADVPYLLSAVGLTKYGPHPLPAFQVSHLASAQA